MSLLTVTNLQHRISEATSDVSYKTGSLQPRSTVFTRKSNHLKKNILSHALSASCTVYSICTVYINHRDAEIRVNSLYFFR